MRYPKTHVGGPDLDLNEVLIQDSEETIYNAEINDSSYESQPGDWGFFLKNPITENQKMSFFSSTNIKFTIWEQFLRFRACKLIEIDAIGKEVAQQIKLSGCPTKGHFAKAIIFAFYC